MADSQRLEAKKRVAQVLTKALDDRGWSYRELAEAAGVSPASVGFHVTGRYLAKPETLRKYARALDLSEDYLLVIAGHRTERRKDRPPELQAVVDLLDEDWEHYSEDRRALLRDLIRRRDGKRG
jgi:transcriptional regulator with XRE-family HTH domain